MSIKFLELDAKERPYAELHSRILKGDVFIVRNCLEEIGLLNNLKAITNSGISELFGNDTTEKIRQVGIEKIHKILEPEKILELTEYTYTIARRECFGFLNSFVREIFQNCPRFYFERKANVRFHIPFDLTTGKDQLINSYIRRIGPGKINPHGPHRDSWVSQPYNVINVWVAAGPVKSGNSMIIYPEAYKRNIKRSSRYIRSNENPGPGINFSLQTGDVLLFHSDHLHSSEINSTDSTRHVISFRLAFEKPQYTSGPFGNYAHSALVGGPWDKFADIPQKFALSYIRCRSVNRVKRRLVLSAKKLIGMAGYEVKRRPSSSSRESQNLSEEVSRDTVHITDSANISNIVKVLSDSLCIARTEDGQIVVFERYCPHHGADLSFGTMHSDKIMCPWHNLPISLKTGSSPCQSLNKLKVYPRITESDLRNLLVKELSL